MAKTAKPKERERRDLDKAKVVTRFKVKSPPKQKGFKRGK